MANEIISLYESVGRRLGDIFVKGTPTNATPTAFQSNVLLHRLESQLRGKEVFWYSGSGAGQARLIASYVASVSSGLIIHEQKYDTTPDSTSKFIIFDKFTVEDYESAMNRAIGKAGMVYLADMSATMAIVATQYEYPVPSGLEFIDNIRFVPTQDTDYAANDDVSNVFELHPRYWKIEGNPGGSRLIVFDPRKINFDSYNGQVCRVEGQAKPDFTGTLIPTDLQEFVITFAAMELASQKDGNEWARRYYMLRDEVKGRSDSNNSSPGLEDMIFRHARGRAVH